MNFIKSWTKSVESSLKFQITCAHQLSSSYSFSPRPTPSSLSLSAVFQYTSGLAQHLFFRFGEGVLFPGYRLSIFLASLALTPLLCLHYSSHASFKTRNPNPCFSLFLRSPFSLPPLLP
ncbi:hypothetical protein ACTXT7_014455 [Hymenolepis weldensis]